MGTRIAVVGVGALGGYVGGNLARAGHDVTLVDFWPENIEAIRARGLQLDGMSDDERFTVTDVAALHVGDVQSLARQAPIDIALVAVKSYDTEWATTLIRPHLSPGGYVVSLQNCLNEERIAGVVGWGRTVGTIASMISVDMVEAGHVLRTIPKMGDRHTVFRCGEVHGRISRRIEELVELFSLVDSAKATTNLWGERWSKLVLNGMVNGVSSATGLPVAGVNRNDAVRRFSIQLGGEAVRIGQALGFDLERIGRFEPEDLALASRRRRRRPGPGGGPPDQGGEAQPPRRHPPPLDGAGRAEGPPHRDRVHQRLHRRQGRGDRPPRPGQRPHHRAGHRRRAGRARTEPGPARRLSPSGLRPRPHRRPAVSLAVARPASPCCAIAPQS